jgi:2'-hydroxyisoflavone reductase
VALTRRHFALKTAALAAAASLPGLSRRALAREEGQGEQREKGLDLLVLGGTGLIGPALVAAAAARGHRLTMFNRGRTRPDLFPEIEKLRGDRDPAVGEGLKALEGKKFDVVFDDCGYYPRHVKASAELLAPNIGHYVFISSISAYSDNSKEGQDETATLATMEDETLETMGDQFQYYGPLKVLCERAAEAACKDRTTIIRPGYIVGPEDWSDRFTYWPLRMKRGGEMLVPGDGTEPVQIIDVRDLADFMITVAETKAFGVFNACGPKDRLTMSAMLDACRKVTGGAAQLTYASVEFLAAQGALEHFPIFAPFAGESKGFHTWSNRRAIEAGMRFRSLEDTIEATLAWFATLKPERQAKLRAGPPPEKEAELLAALAAK